MNTMNKITHHLSDQLLIGYSAGSLPEAFNLVVATHLSMCDECRAAAQSFDSIGGALLQAQPTENLGDAALAKTMALIAKGPKAAASKPGTPAAARITAVPTSPAGRPWELAGWWCPPA